MIKQQDVDVAIQRVIKEVGFAGLDVQAVAERSGYARHHYMRSVRRATGKTVYQHITQAKMLQADAMIKQGAHREVIAEVLGYKSNMTFSRAYAAWRLKNG